MCGINGILFNKNFNINKIREYINTMNSVLSHRGPDHSDIYLNENLGLGHTRLSIIDTSSLGNQPMVSFSGRYVMTYNGEIYNHLDLREQIRKKFNFLNWNGTSDTETLVNLFEFFEKEKVLNFLNGMFAFALWDKKEKKLFLARDRFGEKPIYYSFQNNNFLFFSELKCLKALKEFKREIDKDSINIFSNINYIPAPYTVYKNVYKLEPGSFIEIDTNFKGTMSIYKNKNINTTHFKKKKLWNVSQEFRIDKNLIYSEKLALLEKSLDSAVSSQLISDVKIGSFLSGGIDSALISYFMQKNSVKQIDTYTVKTEHKLYDESKKAKIISEFIGSNHNEYLISRNDIQNYLPKMFEVYDEPFSDSSQIPTYFLSKAASKKIKVALTGDAGDEMFGGYIRHIWLKKILNITKYLPFYLRVLLGKGLLNTNNQTAEKAEKIINLFLSDSKKIVQLDKKLGKLGNLLLSPKIHSLYLSLISVWPSKKHNLKNINLEKYFGSENLGNFQLKNILLLDKDNYLHDDVLTKVDRASMANSLETRAPFLDKNISDISNLFSESEMIKNGIGKKPLRSLAEKIFPSHIVKQPKMGFGIPLNSWMRTDLKDWINDEISSKFATESEFIDNETLKSYFDEHLNNNKNFSEYIWNSLILINWLKNN